jgi:hypothetical protein
MANTKITNPELFNLGDSTSATQLPVMTTTQRIAMNAPPTFNVDYLVVAGGGGAWMGGGGAGGLLTNVGGTALSLNTATPYNVTVGGGGAGAATYSGTSANGSNSIFDSLTSIGGGFGGQNFGPAGATGGSGGGGAPFASTNPGPGGLATGTGLGNNGGASATYSSANGGFYGAGGGGGAGALGGNGTVSSPTLTGGNGGNGLQNNITGTSTYYAGGGGGGVFGDATGYTSGTGGSGGGGNGAIQPSSSGGAAGSNATANTGGGGGGGSGLIATAGFAGGSGGSGIVILRYPTADVASYTATGLTPTETTVGTDTILSFTTVGTGTITFTLSTPTGTISTGEMIFNSTTDKVEYWDGTKWYGITYEVVTNPADPTGNGGVWAYYPLTANSNDGSGNGRNATNNGVSFSADGGRFTGGNSISPPTGFIDFGYTQTCWVKDLSTLAPHRIFSFNGHAGGYYGFTNADFYYYNSSSYGFFTNQRSTSGTYYYTSNTINNFNSGYNLVVAQFVSGQLVKFSLNGQTLQTGTVSITSGNPGGPYQTVREIGRSFSNGAYANVQDSYFRNYRLYDRTLTDAEIMAIYNYGSV